MKTYESGESVNESGDESGLRVDTAPPRPPISSPFASTEMDGKTGEKGWILHKLFQINLERSMELIEQGLGGRQRGDRVSSLIEARGMHVYAFS